MASMSVRTVYPCSLKFGDFKDKDKTKHFLLNMSVPWITPKDTTNVNNN
mgnify:CR=1 FL=1